MLAVLIDRNGLENVEALAVLLVDLGTGRRGRDQVARADRFAPYELLTTVHHRGEVHADIGVEKGWTQGARAVDDAEHRRSDHVPVAGIPCRQRVEMDRLVESQYLRVLADLLPSHLVLVGGPASSDCLIVDRHRGET